MKQKQIIILGGGYGGVLTAKHLLRSMKKYKLDCRLTLIDQNPFHTMLTELHEVAAGRVSEESIRMDFHRIFAGRKIDVIQDRIESVDLDGKVLQGQQRTYQYDYLVLCAGSRPTYYNTKGGEAYAFPLWSYDDAVRLRDQIESRFERAYRETDPAVRSRMLTFAVVGAGFTGVEMAGELAEYVPILCKRYHIPREEVRIVMADLIGRIIPTLPERLGEKAHKRLEKMGVETRLETRVTEIAPDFVELQQENNEAERIFCDTTIWTAGIESARVTQETGLPTKGRGRIETGGTLSVQEHPEVYVVGDNLFYVPEGEIASVPQMVENAELSAGLAASNLLADLRGIPDDKKDYRPGFHGVMVSVGGRWGTAYVGTAKHKIALPSFFAMAVKHLINLFYFLQVMGFHKIFTYLRHEFFQIRNRRSFVGGHLSRNAPSFWLAPLRVFLGVMWLIEFWSKWDKWIANPGNVFLFALPGADSVTSASVNAGAEMAVYGTPLPVPGWISSIVDWSMATFVAPIAPLVQGAMILAELLVGLALIAGLFTVPASLVSMGMCVMIYLSGMASKDILWYFFISIGMLSGGGSAFSLDYYLLPWLKEKWNRLGWVRKWYWYLD